LSQTKFLIAIDPGMSSGIAMFQYGEHKAAELVESEQIPGGVANFYESEIMERTGWIYISDMTVICERFVPLSEDGFSHTSDSLEPLRIEGMLIGDGIMSADYTDKRWQRASCQLITGSGSDTTRKQASNALLKEYGMWVTGVDVGQPDADDAISAIKHGIYYLKNVLKHRPTIEKFWPRT